MGNIDGRNDAEDGLYENFINQEDTIRKTIDVIGLIVENRDTYTAGHQRRVASLAFAISRKLALPKGQSKIIYLSSLIHDLGKISIPSEILSKPVRLNDAEFSLVKRHPQVAYDIIKTVDYPWPIDEIILQHHEKENGSGYPFGISGSDIRLEAKIIAVADIVEALSSHRPYRPAFDIDRTLSEVCKGRTTLYDPVILDACCDLFSCDRPDKFEFDTYHNWGLFFDNRTVVNYH